MILNFKAILWDFDGVIMDSMSVRDQGFVEVLKDYPKDQVGDLLAFHRKNGGLSRYVKFRYFFEEIRKESITEQEIQNWANQFSSIMKELLVNPELLIQDSLAFIKKKYKTIPMHIISGSDQTELLFLCAQLGIESYFKSIHGSPTPKKQLVKVVLQANNYRKSDCILIGDSWNDLEAAEYNQISFAGVNNIELANCGYQYITEFQELLT